MIVTIIRCQSSKHFRDFLQVPFQLHKNDLNWVPPLRMTTKRILDKKNPLYKNADLALWVAYRNNKPVGRIAGIINHSHNQFYDEQIAFWGFFETENSDEVTSGLFRHVEEWVGSQGVIALRGPMNPSINYECGLQISAFDTKPFIMMPQNPDYYPNLVEKQGYEKIKDLQAWIATIGEAKIEPKKVKIIKALQKKHQVSIRPINMKDFSNEMESIAKIYNDAWQENWGYLPLDLEEFHYLASELKSIIMPEFIYIAEIAGIPCGFSVGIPDINQVLLSIRNGKLLPFNFLKILWKIKIKKSITQGRIPMLGVLKKYQHIPIGGMLYCEHLEKISASNCFQAEFSWILEDNQAMQSGLALMNAEHYKTYRIYQKTLKQNQKSMKNTMSQD